MQTTVKAVTTAAKTTSMAVPANDYGLTLTPGGHPHQYRLAGQTVTVPKGDEAE